MNKSYNRTPLLDEILNRRKAKGRKKLNIQLIVCGIIGMIMTLACIVSSSKIEDIFACWFLIAILSACFLWPYYNVVITKERIKKALNGCTDAELENSLLKSEQLDEFVYLSDEYILDFFIGNGAKLSEITGIRKYMQMELKGYVIVIYSTIRIRQFILFRTRQQRAAAIEKIKEAISRTGNEI